MCVWDCKHVLHCLRMIRILFAANKHLLVFCANTKRMYAPCGQVCSMFVISLWKINLPRAYRELFGLHVCTGLMTGNFQKIRAATNKNHLVTWDLYIQEANVEHVKDAVTRSPRLPGHKQSPMLHNAHTTQNITTNCFRESSYAKS